MYTGLLHTHTLVVTLFLLIYLVKTVLLISGKQNTLDNFTKKVKIPEMVISFLFLATGVGMMILLPSIHPMIWYKVIAVVVSIPLAVIGFKKRIKVLSVASLLLLVGAYGLAEMSKKASKGELKAEVVTAPDQADYDQIAHGKALYSSSMPSCISCHGENGGMGNAGAKNLQVSELSEAATKSIIINGKNAMPSYEGVFEEEELSALVAYVHSLRE